MRLEDKRLNLKEGSIPSLFPSKEDIDAGSETWWNHRVNLMLLHKNLARRPPKRQQNREQSRGVEPRPR